MATVITRIGPGDHGRRMALDEFEHAEAADDGLYELGRGVIAVVDVPNPRHQGIVEAIREQLYAYKARHRDRVHAIASGSECKILLEDFQSERHPDLAVYRMPPPAELDGDELWSSWIPELVVEVVSPRSAHRDYNEKPEEYHRFGVREYWIVDPEKRELLAHRRSRGAWNTTIIRPPAIHRTPLLPDLELDLAATFQTEGE